MIELINQLGVPKQYAGDIGLLIVFLAVSLALVVLVKKQFLTTLLFSIYAAFAIFFASSFGFLTSANTKIIYFAVIVAVSFFIIKSSISSANDSYGSWLKSLLLASSIVFLLVNITFRWIPANVVKEFFTPFAIQLFSSGTMHFVWMALPLFLLFLFKKQFLKDLNI